MVNLALLYSRFCVNANLCYIN